MRSLFTACFGLLSSTVVMADKYGIDEINAENEGSWGAVIIVIIVMGYLYFKNK